MKESSKKVLKLRPSVQRFAQAMEAKLRENDFKGGWSADTVESLVHRLDDEVKELKEALGLACDSCGTGGSHSPDSPSAILEEAADVANFAMMISERAS